MTAFQTKLFAEESWSKTKLYCR